MQLELAEGDDEPAAKENMLLPVLALDDDVSPKLAADSSASAASSSSPAYPLAIITNTPSFSPTLPNTYDDPLPSSTPQSIPPTLLSYLQEPALPDSSQLLSPLLVSKHLSMLFFKPSFDQLRLCLLF